MLLSAPELSEQSSSSAPTFVTLKSVGVHDVSDTFSYAPRTSPQVLHTLSWEWHSRERVLNGIAARAGREDGEGRSTRSRHRTRPLRQLDDIYDHRSTDAQQPAVQMGTEAQALHSPEKNDSEHGKLTPRDPNIVGFVPAFILGNVYMCKLPDSTDDQIKEGRLEESTDSMDPPHKSQVPRPAHLSLLLAMGNMGAAAGLVGLFASKAAAQLVARQAYKQIKPAAPDMPAAESAPAGNSIVKSLQRAARGIADRAERLLQLKPGSRQGEEDSEDAEMRSGMKDAISKAETAMAQAEGILKQLDQAAEELFMKELSVMPMPLALALDLVMGHPNRVHLVGLPSKGKARAQKASKQKHKGKNDQAGDASVQPGMMTYTIPGIAFGMPSSVGPLHFAPVFTSRHTAEIAWDVVREMLILRHIQKRKLRRHVKRHITEMGAALLTGLQSRVETQEVDEDEEGMSEPSEVADFLNELGESDNRPSKNKTRFRPRGPLDLLGALACGVVSLYARTMEWGGDAADEVLFHSPIGGRAVGMSGRPAMEEVPLQDAIASARDWNRGLQQTALARQAIAVQQSSHAQEVLDEPGSNSNGQGEMLAGAQHAQHGKSKGLKSGKEEASREAQQQHSSAPAQAQRAQQDLNKEAHQSSAAKHAQHGGNSSGLNAAPAQAASQLSSPSTDSSASTGAGGASSPSQSSSSGTDQQTASAASSSPSSQQASAKHQPSSCPSHPWQPDKDTKQGDPLADCGEQPGRQHQAPVQKHSQSQSKSQSGAKPQPKVHEVAAELPDAGQVLQMPPRFPTTDDVKCVLGSGERLTMLDGLQGTLAGLAVKVLTGPALGDKVESPFQIPIYSLKGAQSGTPIDDSMADGTTASVHFDLPLATGRKKTAAKKKSKKGDSAESVGQGLVLVGDIGFEKYKTASDYLKAKKQLNEGRFSEASVGFGNLSAIASILEQQQQQQDEQGKL